MSISNLFRNKRVPYFSYYFSFLVPRNYLIIEKAILKLIKRKVSQNGYFYTTPMKNDFENCPRGKGL